MTIEENLDYYMALPYRVEVRKEECAGATCFVAYNLELPNCMAQGATPEAAVISLREARELYLRSLLEDGLEIPVPSAMLLLLAA